MKKIGIWLLILFFLLALSYAVMQSHLGRNFIRNALIQALVESGYQVTIEQIEGTLPHQIDLKGVAIQKEGIDVTFQKIRLRPVLWRLFKKEVAFNHIHAQGISISKGALFNFDGKFRINQRRALLKGKIASAQISLRLNLKTSSATFSAHSNLFNAKGNAVFSPAFELLSANVQIDGRLLSSGRLLAAVHLRKEEGGYFAKGAWQTTGLAFNDWTVGPLKGEGEIFLKDRTLKGTLTAEPLAKAVFDLKVRPDWLIVGTSEIDLENLQILHIPEMYGKLHAKASWDAADQVQGVHLDAALNDFYYKSLFAKTISLYSDLNDPFHHLNGLFDIEAEKLKWHHLELDAASLETVSQGKNWPFRLFAEGTLRHPFELHAEGGWENGGLFQIENLNGVFLGTPFALEQAIQMTATQDAFRIPEAGFSVGKGSAFIDIDRRKKETNARIQLNAIPLDFLSFNPLEVAVQGTMTLNALIKEKNHKLQGNLKALLDQTLPIAAFGEFDGKFDGDSLQLKGTVAIQNTPFLNADLSIPIHFSMHPFGAEILFHKNAKGSLSINGQIEEILDYFDLGPHRLEGHLLGNIHFRNTLYRPLIEGRLYFENGAYENYYSGTQLKNIEAEFLAEKNILYMRSLTAADEPGTGKFTANGEIHLLQSDRYPFRIDAHLDHLKFAEIDLVSASADGKVRLEGNALSAVAKGDVRILKSELAIPDHIPRPLPNLEVVYRNQIHPIIQPQVEYKPYPLHLDLNVTAPADVFISGRGLSSNWKGNFHLGGTYTSLAAKGTLELIEGEFNFSSRSFKLIEGSLALSGIEHQMPSLNLAGTMQMKGITITARLKGALDNPQLTLQSSPPLPLGSIMSYLLFGQDISEIGGFQALQLATSLASFAGTGPDVMETTRRSLGVDRLRIITDPTEEGGETVALQVGKYISKGVLVSFTQGTEESSTNISVEIELKDNFVFQIESDQHQEQGKFTLKWNLNY